MRARTASALLVSALFAVGCADAPTGSLQPDAPSFAHESNNRATLTGMQGGSAITGIAIINYVAGREAWRSTVGLRGNLAAGTYTLFAISPNGATSFAVCSFTVDGMGSRQGCSADTDVGGFLRAEVRDASGNVVASGRFMRRGGNREG